MVYMYNICGIYVQYVSYIQQYVYIVVLGSGTLWHLQKIYVLFEKF
jgi:hypothetical protein